MELLTIPSGNVNYIEQNLFSLLKSQPKTIISLYCYITSNRDSQSVQSKRSYYQVSWLLPIWGFKIMMSLNFLLELSENKTGGNKYSWPKPLNEKAGNSPALDLNCLFISWRLVWSQELEISICDRTLKLLQDTFIST